MDPQRALLEQLYIDFNDRDIDAVTAVLHPDVDWENDWKGGRVHGRDGVKEYWRDQWAEIDPHATPLSFSPSADGRMAVEVRQVTHDKAGKVLSDRVVTHIYSFVDGLIRSRQLQS
jgi:ketosteroid isomerase-like protein